MAMKRYAEFKVGNLFRRQDGAVIVLETRLPDGRWGGDLLENGEGQPDPEGDPACCGLIVDAETLMQSDPIRRR